MRQEKSGFDAVLFDLDGTLVDSVEDIAASANHVRAHMGLAPLPPQVVQTYVGDGVHVLFERVLQTQEMSVLENAIALWHPYYLTHCLEHTRLYPGVMKILQQLHSLRIPMGVVSNKPVVPSEVILKGLSIHDMFRVVVGGDSTSRRKPNPEPLQLAIKQMNLDSKRILVVGDSPNDILGARNAGYVSCGVLWGIGDTKILRAAQPDHLAQTPDEVQSLIVCC